VTNLESITLFTTGVRLTLLVLVIVALLSSVRRRTSGVIGSVFQPIANSPKTLLMAVLTLLITSLLELAIEIYDHWHGLSNFLGK